MRPTDPTDLAGQMADDEEQALRARQLRELELQDFRWLMSHAEGRRIVWRLLGHAGVYRTSFTGNSTTFFNEGRRDVGLFLLAEVQDASPNGYIKMFSEQRKKADG